MNRQESCHELYQLLKEGYAVEFRTVIPGVNEVKIKLHTGETVHTETGSGSPFDILETAYHEIPAYEEADELVRTLLEAHAHNLGYDHAYAGIFTDATVFTSKQEQYAYVDGATLGRARRERDA